MAPDGLIVVLASSAAALLCLYLAGRFLSAKGPLALGLFFAFSCFIHVILPAFQVTVGYFRYSQGYEILTHLQGLMLYLISISFVFIGYRVVAPLQTNNKIAPGASMNISLLFILATIAIAAPAAGAAAYLLQKIEAVGIIHYFRNRIFWRADYGPLAALTKLMPVYATLSTLAFLQSGGRLKIIIGFALAAITIFWTYYTIRTGIRFDLFSWLAAMLVAWLLATPRPPLAALRRAALPILAMALVFTVGGELRAAFAGFRSAAVTSDSFVRGVNGAFGNHENILWMVENEPPKTYGASYVAMITNFVPRAIWAEKPTGGGPLLTNLIFPGSYKVGQAGASSITTGFLTEAVMNGGLFAILLVGLVFGGYLRFADNLAARANDALSASMASIHVLYGALLAVFSEWSQMATQVVLSVIALVLLRLGYTFLRSGLRT